MLLIFETQSDLVDIERVRNPLEIASTSLYIAYSSQTFGAAMMCLTTVHGSHSESKDKTNINNILRINARLPSSEI